MSKAKNELTATRLQRLFSGDYDPGRPIGGLPPLGEGTADALVLPGTNPDALGALTLDEDSFVFAPADLRLRSQDTGGATVVAYEGGPTPGDDDELLLPGGLVVAFESYVSAAFVPLTCPVVISMAEADDHASFLQDADAAVETGDFPEFLVHPLAMLADVCGLGTTHVCAAPQRRRAVVGPDGSPRPSLAGLRFADGDGAQTACAVCLGRVVAPADLTSAREQRPWLSRYLLVLEVLRLAGNRFGPLRVSGFGHRLTADLSPEPVESLGDPVLLDAGDTHLVCDPASGRVLRIGSDAARVLEVVLAREGDELVEDVARHLELSSATASSVVSELQATLDALGFPLRMGAPA